METLKDCRAINQKPPQAQDATSIAKDLSERTSVERNVESLQIFVGLLLF